MECREVREYLPAYDEQAEGPRAGAVESHLRTCNDCRTELEQFRELGQQMHALATEVIEPPAWMLGTLIETVGERAARLEALRARSRRLTDAGRRLTHPRNLATGGALVVAGLAGALLMRGMRRRRRRTSEQLSEALAEA